MKVKEESYKTFLKLSDEAKSIEPVVSLVCKMYYAQRFLANKRKSGVTTTPEEQEELTKLFQEIENGKKIYEISKEKTLGLLEQFCAKQYTYLNKEDCAEPKLFKSHAKRYNSLNFYIELLSFYDGLTPQWIEISNFIHNHRGIL